MHEHSNDEPMATGRGQDGPGLRNGPVQRENASRPVVARRPQHGDGLADSAEPAAGRREDSHAPATNLGRVGPHGIGVDVHASCAGPSLRMACVGQCEGDPGAAVHPEEQAPVVGTPVSTGNVLILLEQQRYRCALSGRQLTPQTAALDHIVPIRCGGEHVLENTQVLHKDVNRAKGSLASGEFIALCREVTQWSGRYLSPHHIERRLSP